jgi:hypothetical protein
MAPPISRSAFGHPCRRSHADGAYRDPVGSLEIPAGFRKVDPQALIERIKQSDVWVEPLPR